MADNKKNKRNNNRSNNMDEDFNPKFRKVRKKVCPLCADKNLVLDYKGKILPRRETGACAKHQRDITLAIKRARQIAVLPYTQE